MTPKERAAMQQALEALENERSHMTANWDNIVKAITALREANAKYAKQAEQEPVKRFTSDDVKVAFENGYAAGVSVAGVAKEAEQEPDYFGLTHDHTWLSIDKKQYDKLKPEGRMACYAAPVRTKELTDDQKQLARFYQVETLSELVDAMEKHIEKLQARIQHQPMYMGSPRKG